MDLQKRYGSIEEIERDFFPDARRRRLEREARRIANEPQETTCGDPRCRVCRREPRR